jgi:hypothetical protein
MFATLKYFTGKIIQTCNVAWAPITSLIIYLLMHGFDPTPFQMKKVILVYKPCTMLQVKLIFFKHNKKYSRHHKKLFSIFIKFSFVG